MDNKLFITLGLLAILLDFASCFFIRQMIWSIVWCDMGGKYNKLMKLKQGQNIFSRLNMKYLQNFTHQNIKQFHFWINLIVSHSPSVSFADSSLPEGALGFVHL